MSLRGQVEADGTYTYHAGLHTDYDGLAIGDYIYSTSNNETPDDWNIVQPDAITSGPGRWIKLFRNEIDYPQGRLWRPNGYTATLFVDATIGSSGEVTVNLTKDNTTNGSAIFSSVFHVDAFAWRNSSSALDTASGMAKALANSNKQLTVKFADGINMLLLGASMENTASGVAIKIAITGKHIN